MKKNILSLLFAAIALSLSAQTAVDKANAAYSSKDYQTAVQLYTQILQENGASADVYYNLGNAYYRLHQIAPAILNYERALLLNPANKDARVNLEIAKLKTVDKIADSHFFLTDWLNSLRNLYSTNQWSAIAITGFILLIACLFLFVFSRKIALKKIGFYAGLALLAVTLVSNIFASQQKKKLPNRNTAIISAATTTIKSAPDASGTDLFILHEGTKVSVTDQLGEGKDWKKIETADGNIGWIPSTEIAII
jgi:tetratricopeptide (TPR) repeat protein